MKLTLSLSAIARLRRHYERMREFGPLQASTVRALLHACEDEAVKRLADAGIRHISPMAVKEAANRCAVNNHGGA